MVGEPVRNRRREAHGGELRQLVGHAGAEGAGGLADLGQGVRGPLVPRDQPQDGRCDGVPVLGDLRHRPQADQLPQVVPGHRNGIRDVERVAGQAGQILDPELKARVQAAGHVLMVRREPGHPQDVAAPRLQLRRARTRVELPGHHVEAADPLRCERAFHAQPPSAVEQLRVRAELLSGGRGQPPDDVRRDGARMGQQQQQIVPGGALRRVTRQATDERERRPVDLGARGQVKQLTGHLAESVEGPRRSGVHAEQPHDGPQMLQPEQLPGCSRVDERLAGEAEKLGQLALGRTGCADLARQQGMHCRRPPGRRSWGQYASMQSCQVRLPHGRGVDRVRRDRWDAGFGLDRAQHLAQLPEAAADKVGLVGVDHGGPVGVGGGSGSSSSSLAVRDID